MISTNTSSNWVTSCRLAPVTTSDNGTPRPSTNRCRLVPFFPPVGRVPTNCFLRQGGLDHGSVNALPAPGDTLHFIVFGKTGAPEREKKPSMHPSHEMSMDGTGASVNLLGQGLPLAASSQHVHDCFEDTTRRHRLSAPSRLALVGHVRIALRLWNKRFNSFPKRIGHFPRLNFCHTASMIGVHHGCQHSKSHGKSTFYLRIST